VSIGMVEHVGVRNCRAFMGVVERALSGSRAALV
jgi:cyclopropane fatty-acyl-phospholipid synthase-like methyltransferase